MTQEIAHHRRQRAPLGDATEAAGHSRMHYEGSRFSKEHMSTKLPETSTAILSGFAWSRLATASKQSKEIVSKHLDWSKVKPNNSPRSPSLALSICVVARCEAAAAVRCGMPPIKPGAVHDDSQLLTWAACRRPHKR
eukprot:CAMPEP_0172947080 /NCGR_PEP_ID=MMETSP1075-20121228/227389_1 /TAXON_ID=2916 /ORGANISM="Ceratium fusus, Strain PA161109" /LENGTH=136 /DNA_ID=CAMNT_0013808547 /DNA_START=1018 /DNA_END=1429 /DNA_ORIENTATION=+